MRKYLVSLLLLMAICSMQCVPSQPNVDPSLPKNEQAVIYIEWLRHIDPHVTFQGRQRLRELGEDAVPALTDALSDEDRHVRREAAEVLQEIRDDQVWPTEP